VTKQTTDEHPKALSWGRRDTFQTDGIESDATREMSRGMPYGVWNLNRARLRLFALYTLFDPNMCSGLR
jgi:hypothetical protein